MFLGGEAAHSPALFYALLLGVLMFPLHYTVFVRDFASFFGRVLQLVLVPGEEVHFIEVLVGDVLTSLSKVLQELGLTVMAFLISFSVYDIAFFSPDILPTLLGSVPFV
jgi:predicted Na+-dependent transporter